MWAECGKTARDTAENNVSNSCHYPRQEGQREGTTWGSPRLSPMQKGHGEERAIYLKTRDTEAVVSAVCLTAAVTFG